MVEIKQGDSYSLDFRTPKVPVMDANWGGSWAIVPNLGGQAVASGALVLSENFDWLQLRIKPVDIEEVAVADYILVIQIVNDTIEYKHEIHKDISIIAQGILG